MNGKFDISLSPSEDTTLYRVALGIADVATARAQDVDRLILLKLVTLSREGCQLTSLGEQRVLREASRTATPFSSDEIDRTQSWRLKPPKTMA